jgi:hypothetical protein
MGEIETAIRYSKETESFLEAQLGEKGCGLHEKISNIEHMLTSDLIKKLRYIATTRNKVVHEAGYQIDSYEYFVSSCEDTLTLLKDTKPVMQGTTFSTTTTEGKIRQFLLSLATPAAITLSITWGGVTWYNVGIGAALFAVLFGMATAPSPTITSPISMWL